MLISLDLSGLVFCPFFIFVNDAAGFSSEDSRRYMLPDSLEIGLVFVFHLFWWFASPSGCPLHRRAGVGVVCGVSPLLHWRNDGLWPSYSACTFNKFMACWFFWCTTHGAITKPWCCFVGRVVSFRVSPPAAGDGNDRELPYWDLIVILFFFQGCPSKLYDVNYQKRNINPISLKKKVNARHSYIDAFRTRKKISSSSIQKFV